MKKINSKIKIVLLLLVIIAFVSACMVSNDPNKKYIVGFNGVTMDFLKGNPKDVLENEPFSLAILLKNIGFTDIKNNGAILTVSYDEYYLSLDNTYRTQVFTIDGRYQSNPTGGEEYIEYPFFSKKITTLRQSGDTQIYFSLCYPYSTQLTAPVCIDTKTANQDQGPSACKTETFSTGSGQGAPVAITKIVPEMLKVQTSNTGNGGYLQPLFRIYVSNVGKGYPFVLQDPRTACSNSVRVNDSTRNTVRIIANISGQPLTCKPAIIKLHEDGEENYAQCIVPNSNINQFNISRRNYASLLSVQLDYSYVEVNTWNIKIKNSDSDNLDSGGIAVAGECKNYEIAYNNKCLSLCDYCAIPANSNSATCTKNKPTNFVGWQSNFTCGCSQEKCSALSKDGKCIFGYCPGSNYCCTNNVCVNSPDGTECGDSNVCIKGVCEKTISECDWIKGVEGKSCMNQSKCVAGTIETGLCPGIATNVCCNPFVSISCQGKENGTQCGINNAQICIDGFCSTTTLCSFNYGEYNYSCSDVANCRNDSQRLTGFCPIGTNFCCVKK